MLPLIVASSSSGLSPQTVRFLQDLAERIFYLGAMVAILAVLALWFLLSFSIMMSNSICRVDKNDFSKCLSAALLWALLATGVGFALQWPGFGIPASAVDLVNLAVAPLLLG